MNLISKKHLRSQQLLNDLIDIAIVSLSLPTHTYTYSATNLAQRRTYRLCRGRKPHWRAWRGRSGTFYFHCSSRHVLRAASGIPARTQSGADHPIPPTRQQENSASRASEHAPRSSSTTFFSLRQKFQSNFCRAANSIVGCRDLDSAPCRARLEKLAV